MLDVIWLLVGIGLFYLLMWKGGCCGGSHRNHARHSHGGDVDYSASSDKPEHYHHSIGV
jgi:hypothetical protein